MQGGINTRTRGNKGEDIACQFLAGKGFHILARNYLKKWGELDIVAQKDTTIHFFEVKSILYSLLSGGVGHRPEDNVHGLKTKRLRRMVETYLQCELGNLDREFKFHVVCVYMDPLRRRASVKWLENIII